MKVNKEIEAECFHIVSKFHADQIREGCSGITEDQVRHAVGKNWNTISEEVADLYATVITMLEDSKIIF